MMNSLAIITPTLNCAGSIAQTLESLRPLVEQGAEHIVVDSGSTDGTVELCRQAGARILTHPPGNLYAAVNAGIRASLGVWLTYLNGDDLLRADAIAAALTSADHAGADIIYGNIEVIDEAGRLLYAWRTPPATWVRPLQPQIDLILQQGTLIRRDCWERLGGFDESFRYGSDYDFFLRASRADVRFAKHWGRAVAAFRAHAAQLSRRVEVQQAMAEECRRARERTGTRLSPVRSTLARLLMKLLNLDTLALRVPRALARGLLWLSYQRT